MKREIEDNFEYALILVSDGSIDDSYYFKLMTQKNKEDVAWHG